MATSNKLHLGVSRDFIIKSILIIVCLILTVSISWHLTSSNPHTIRTKVLSVQQVTRTHGDKDGFYTSVDYYVHTEAGTFSIPTEGFNAYPHLAGVLKEEGYYTLTVSGVSIPLLGIFQRITNARKEDRK